MLQKDKEVFRSQTDLQRPAWYLDQHGDKVPAYKVPTLAFPQQHLHEDEQG
jgi:hypothetical protein